MRSRLIMIGIVASAAIALGACANQPGGGVPGAPATQDAGQIINQVRDTAVQICAFQPTVATVTNILGTFTSAGGAIASANEIASQICSAISVPRSAKRGASAPAFCGPDKRCVAIRGKWVGPAQ